MFVFRDFNFNLSYLYSHPPQHFLTKSGLVAEPEPRVRRSEHLLKPR